MILSALLVLAVLAPTAPPAQTAQTAWSLDTVLLRARPSPERLATETLLAAAARELTLSRGVLLEGPTLTVETGSRRSSEGNDSDFALGVDLPLAGDRAAKRAALDTFAAAKRLLLTAADLEAGLALRLAYVDAWEAAEALTLARRQAAAAESWLNAVEARVAAGAEAPYEASLVVAEAGLARLALAEARGRVQVTWSELLGRAEIGAQPTSLAEPRVSEPLEPSEPSEPLEPLEPSGLSGLSEASEPSQVAARIGDLERSTLARAIAARSALARALLTLDAARAASRWSLVASAAREGVEEVTRLGAGYRVPFSGQSGARSAALSAAVAEQGFLAGLERTRLEGRLRGARERGAGLAGGALFSAIEMERALAALEARVAAGRDRPSTVLPLRRQLVGALLTELTARAAYLRAAFEIQTLTTETP